MRFTFKQLQVFVSVAHFGSVSQAAESLAMSQSACSGALKELEQAYEMQFFDRVGKRVVINAAGKQLWAEAKNLLDRTNALEHRLLKHEEEARVKLGATLTIGNYLAVELMQQFMDKTGGSATLSVENTQHIIEAILRFDLDIALIEGEVNHPDLEVIPWREDQLTAFCHPDHPFAHKVVSDNDVLLQPWILREPGSGTRQAFDRVMHGLMPKLNVLWELQQPEAIKRSVKVRLGIACLSTIALEDAFSHKTLAPFTIKNRHFTRQFYVILHKNKYRSHGIRQWLSLLNV